MRRPTDAETRSTLARLDWLLLGAVLGLALVGSLLVWSATSTRDDLTGGDPAAYLWKQVVNIASGWRCWAPWPSPTTGGCGSSHPWSTSPPWSGWSWCW